MRGAHRHRLLALILAVTLSGCTAGPDYKPPAAPDAGGYTTRPLPAQTIAAPGPNGDAQRFVAGMDVPRQWWTMFRSPALNAVVQQALDHNPDIHGAQAALRQAQENAGLQRVLALPDASATASAAREKLSIGTLGAPTILSPFSLATTAVLVTYQLDLFGERRRTIESAEAESDVARFKLEATYLTLISNVVVAAIEEASLRAQIAAVSEIAVAERKQIELTANEHALGNEARTTVLAHEALLAETETERLGLEKALDRQRNVLAMLSGRFPDQGLAESFTLSDLTLPLELPVSLPSQLVQQRPDVRASESHLHAANAAIGIVEARMFPQVTLSGAYGGATTSIPGLSDSASWIAQSTVNMPLTGIFALRRERRMAAAERDQAEAQYRKTVLAAFHEVSDVLHALDWDAKTLKNATMGEQSTAQQSLLSRQQFESGDTSQFAVLDTARFAARARAAAARAQAARLTDVAALFQALGGGWWSGKPPDSSP
jgi:NodT family efflux transporter outer membrane factor (OMF) lipoprotein